MKTKALTVHAVPFLTSPDFCSGIRDENAAREWGEKNAYSQVYYLPGKQRVYADKTSTRVDLQAQVIERKSASLLNMAERGGALLEFILLTLLVLLIVFALGYFLGWPW